MGTTGKGLHINVPLSNVAMDYKPMNMIADAIFPIVDVMKQSDGYVIWSQADIFRKENDSRAPGTEANKISLRVTSATYFAKNYALKMALAIEDDVNMDDIYKTRMREGRAMTIKDKLMLNWEVRAANLVTSTSNVGSSSAVASAWTDHTNGKSDPLGDIWTAMQNVEDTTGYKPNRIIMGQHAWREFRKHADVISILFGNNGTGQARYASREQVKAIFELESFHVGGMYYSTAEEGQNAAISSLWGDKVLVYYAPQSPRTEEPSFAYSFRWAAPGLPNMQVEVHPYDRKTKSEEVELGYYQDEKITGSTLGFLITHTTSST